MCFPYDVDGIEGPRDVVGCLLNSGALDCTAGCGICDGCKFGADCVDMFTGEECVENEGIYCGDNGGDDDDDDDGGDDDDDDDDDGGDHQPPPTY